MRLRPFAAVDSAPGRSSGARPLCDVIPMQICLLNFSPALRRVAPAVVRRYSNTPCKTCRTLYVSCLLEGGENRESCI